VAVVHQYQAAVRWSGSTGVGYDAYDRTHHLACPPATAALRVASDPAFGGDPSLLNPEQLLLAAAASCQLLSFLAVAARARLDVVAYRDDAEAVMDESDRPARITTITLRPRITLRPGPSEEQVRHLVEVAHRECYIANSLRSEIIVEPCIECSDPEVGTSSGL
jgi:organic hydroperoxide reductase OsmC/OhrA